MLRGQFTYVEVKWVGDGVVRIHTADQKKAADPETIIGALVVIGFDRLLVIDESIYKMDSALKLDHNPPSETWSVTPIPQDAANWILDILSAEER